MTRPAKLGLIVAGLLVALGAGYWFGVARSGSAIVSTATATATATAAGAGAVPTSTIESSPNPTPTETAAEPPESTGPAVARPAGTVPAAPIAAFHCPTATVRVGTAPELSTALRTAKPGTVIGLRNGIYHGNFTAAVSGTTAKPVWLCGGRDAVLQGPGFKDGYVLHFARVSHWRAAGFTVTDGQKGVMVDRGSDIGLQALLVERIGDEAVHLRDGSTANVVRGLTIRDTGNRREKFGEGVYIGTAKSNWSDITGGRPDRSDRNFVLDNRISATTSESVDIKEGTSGGVLAGNTFDGSRLSGADSWVDVKGDGWLIAGNRGRTSPKDGFQTHVVLDGWGDSNRFVSNQADLAGGSGVGFYLHRQLANRVGCDNRASGAAEGLTNHPCTG